MILKESHKSLCNSR